MVLLEELVLGLADMTEEGRGGVTRVEGRLYLTILSQYNAAKCYQEGQDNTFVHTKTFEKETHKRKPNHFSCQRIRRR